jgi:hypothetical protein
MDPLSAKESKMLRRMNLLWAVAIFAAILAIVGTAFAQKQPVVKPLDKPVLAENEVKQLLLLMDTDKSGKISKQEWMRFMEAEVDRLDKDKSGELDVKEISQSRVRASRFANAGKY